MTTAASTTYFEREGMGDIISLMADPGRVYIFCLDYTGEALQETWNCPFNSDAGSNLAAHILPGLTVEHSMSPIICCTTPQYDALITAARSHMPREVVTSHLNLGAEISTEAPVEVLAIMPNYILAHHTCKRLPKPTKEMTGPIYGNHTSPIGTPWIHSESRANIHSWVANFKNFMPFSKQIGTSPIEEHRKASLNNQLYVSESVLLAHGTHPLKYHTYRNPILKKILDERDPYSTRIMELSRTISYAASADPQLWAVVDRLIADNADIAQSHAVFFKHFLRSLIGTGSCSLMLNRGILSNYSYFLWEHLSIYRKISIDIDWADDGAVRLTYFWGAINITAMVEETLVFSSVGRPKGLDNAPTHSVKLVTPYASFLVSIKVTDPMTAHDLILAVIDRHAEYIRVMASHIELTSEGLICYARWRPAITYYNQVLTPTSVILSLNAYTLGRLESQRGTPNEFDYGPFIALDNIPNDAIYCGQKLAAPYLFVSIAFNYASFENICYTINDCPVNSLEFNLTADNRGMPEYISMYRDRSNLRQDNNKSQDSIGRVEMTVFQRLIYEVRTPYEILLSLFGAELLGCLRARISYVLQRSSRLAPQYAILRLNTPEMIEHMHITLDVAPGFRKIFNNMMLDDASHKMYIEKLRSTAVLERFSRMRADPSCMIYPKNMNHDLAANSIEISDEDRDFIRWWCTEVDDDADEAPVS